MKCLVVSASSLQTCLRNSVFAMTSFLLTLNLLTKLAMFTWVPSYFLILSGLWSVKDFLKILNNKVNENEIIENDFDLFLKNLGNHLTNTKKQ